MSVISEQIHIPFRFGGANIPYYETEQQGASRIQADILKSKRLGEIQNSLRSWIHDDEADQKTKSVETTDITADNIIMALPEYKADLDRINFYLYQMTSRNHYPDSPRLTKVQKLKLSQPEDPQLKRKLFSLCPLRYNSKTELWQQVLHSEWDRKQSREPFQSEPIPDAKKHVFKNQICRKYAQPGEWIEPDQELIDYLMKHTLVDPLNVGRKRFYSDEDREIKENKPHDNLYLSTARVSYRKFPDSEYRPSNFARKNPFSNTVNAIDQQSPHGNAEPPEKTGTWVNFLYQPRWA